MVVNDNKGIFEPIIDEYICNNCGLCVSVCAGYEFDADNFNRRIFGKIPDDNLVGNFKKCYIGYAKDRNIRFNCSSGGLVTSLLIFLLKKKIIKGAIVTRMMKNNPLMPDVFIAKTEEEIFSARGSKYCPVPVNSILERIFDEKGKFAFVGLPCHINSLRKAALKNREIREKIIFHFGIFCGHSVTFSGTKHLLREIKLNINDVKTIKYRSNGWPGEISILTKRGANINISDYWANLFAPFFSPIRCFQCSDVFCEFSDLSFGDAWLKKFSSDKIGTSIIISRTLIGEELLQRAKNENIIMLQQIPVSEVKKSQLGYLYAKKKNLRTRWKILRFLGIKNPNYNNSSFKRIKTPFFSYIPEIINFLNLYLVQKKLFLNLIKHPPCFFMRVYLKLIHTISTIEKKHNAFN